MSISPIQPQKLSLLQLSTGEASDSTQKHLNPKVSLDLWNYNLSLSGLGYREPTNILQSFELIAIPSIAGSTTSFRFTDIYEMHETSKVSSSKKKLTTWGEALRQEAVTYEMLKREIQEGFEAESLYWHFLGEDD